MCLGRQDRSELKGGFGPASWARGGATHGFDMRRTESVMSTVTGAEGWRFAGCRPRTELQHEYEGRATISMVGQCSSEKNVGWRSGMAQWALAIAQRSTSGGSRREAAR